MQRAKGCWGCLLGQFGSSSYLFSDGWQVQGLKAPLGQGWCIPSSPQALPLAPAKCSTHHFWFLVSTLYSYSPRGTYFRDLMHKMREIYFSQEVSQGGSVAGEGLLVVLAAACKNPWHTQSSGQGCWQHRACFVQCATPWCWSKWLLTAGITKVD